MPGSKFSAYPSRARTTKPNTLLNPHIEIPKFIEHTVSEHQSHTPSREKRHFLYFNHLSKEFLEQMIPHLKALI